MDDIYWAHEVLLTDVLNEHAPFKEKTVKTKQTPFMNSKLRKAVFKKSMFFNKCKTWRTPANWEAYRMQRNLCTKLKRQSIRHYFSERCAGGPKPTVKTFLSNKGLLKDPVILLSENDGIISNQISVACTLNEFFVNAAQDISSVPIPEDISNHPSIQKITAHIPAPTGFDFSPVTSESIDTFISKCNPKKATGVDGIPAKIIKSCSKSISEPLAKLINHTHLRPQPSQTDLKKRKLSRCIRKRSFRQAKLQTD